MKRDETPIPLAENDRARLLIARLRQGPASTLDLQKNLPLIHVARQVWELRHWYGMNVRTSRLSNNVALYTLVTDSTPDAGPMCKCGLQLGNLTATLDPAYVMGKCRTHGMQTVHL